MRSLSVERVITWIAGLITSAVIACFVMRAIELVLYPYDWSPIEGLMLDWARRLLEAPSTLYPSPLTAVPLPDIYTPLLTVLLAPTVAISDSPLLYARLLMITLAGLSGLAVFVLAGGRRNPMLGLAAVGLGLSPLNWTVYLLIIRVDGLMVAMVLSAAVLLLPRGLGRGCDTLRGWRLIGGSALLLLAVLAKPTAVLTGTPLVLVWILVDTRSALRLAITLGAGGFACLAALQLLTSGGFLDVMGLWLTHDMVEGQTKRIVWYFIRQHALSLSLLGGFVVWAAAIGRRPWREPAWFLTLAGASIVPLLEKSGAYWSYFLVLSLALPILIARIGRAVMPGAATIAMATAAMLLALTRSFPAPSATDRVTAEALYSFVAAHGKGHSVLAFRPEYVYFVAGEPVEVEGSCFYMLAAAKVPGTELVAERAARGEYALVVGDPGWIALAPAANAAIVESYRPVAACNIGFFHAHIATYVFVPRSSTIDFAKPPGADCVRVRYFPRSMLESHVRWLRRSRAEQETAGLDGEGATTASP